MSDDLSPVLSLPLIQPAQAQKHVTHNEALRLLDVLVQPAVESRSLAAPPAFPAEGARWIVPAGATGPWAGQDGTIALYDQGDWVFLAPLPGPSAVAASRVAGGPPGGPGGLRPVPGRRRRTVRPTPAPSRPAAAACWRTARRPRRFRPDPAPAPPPDQASTRPEAPSCACRAARPPAPPCPPGPTAAPRGQQHAGPRWPAGHQRQPGRAIALRHRRQRQRVRPGQLAIPAHRKGAEPPGHGGEPRRGIQPHRIAAACQSQIADPGQERSCPGAQPLLLPQCCHLRAPDPMPHPQPPLPPDRARGGGQLWPDLGFWGQFDPNPSGHCRAQTSVSP